MSEMNRKDIFVIHFRPPGIFLFVILILTGAFLFAEEFVDAGANWTHDPGTIQCGDYFYVYSTGDSTNPLVMRRSKNLHNWEYLGSVIPEVPGWVQEKITEVDNLWAPEPFYHNGKYYLNYSASSWGSNESTIALLSNVTLDPDSPDYEWVDEGEIISSADNTSVFYNTIDGSFVRDQSGQVWLSFGSFWGGIKLVRLNSTTLKPANSTLYSIAWNPHTTYYPIEAPHIVYRNGYYYLFVNHDFCCSGVDSTYKIMVGRSSTITGPYYDQDSIDMMDGGGTLFNGSGDRWIGPGHAFVFNVDGQDFVSFHAYDALNNGRHSLRVHYLDWEGGWPVLGEAVTPDEEGVIGCWDFEDGTPNALMNDTGLNEQVGSGDLSGNDYHMYAWNDTTGASFSSEGQTPTGSGLSARYDGGQDTYTASRYSENQDAYAADTFINNWSPAVWTIEVAVKLDNLSGWQTMIGRDGASHGEAEADFYFQKNDTNDRFRLNFETVGGQRYTLDADFTVVPGQWYYLAGVCDGNILTMYADKLDGNGSQVVGTLSLSTTNDNALAAPDEPWTFGRGWYNGNPVDYIEGNLDNIRFTGRALAPGEFLHYQCGVWGYLENDLNFDCDVNLEDFMLFATAWVGDTSAFELFAEQWLSTTQPYADGAVHGQ